MAFLSLERSLPLFFALLTSFLNAVVLLTDLTGQDHGRVLSLRRSASRLFLYDYPEVPLRSQRWEVQPERGDLGEAGSDEIEVGLHQRRSFPVRREFVLLGF